ncbi:IS3 family transposase [Enterobacteriaceae bacterium LUAb1]
MGLLKTEYGHDEEYENLEHLRKAVEEYLHDHNNAESG